MIVAGILLICVAGTVCLVLLARWLVRVGETRIGLADMEAFIPQIEDVAAREATLPRMPTHPGGAS